MKNFKFWLVILLFVVPFIYPIPVQEKSLSEIYKSGTVQFLQELTIEGEDWGE